MCSSPGQSCSTLGMVPALGALGCDSRAPIGTDWAAPRDLPSAASQHVWVMPAAAAGSWRWPGVSQGWTRGLYMSESASSPGCCSCS